MKVLKSLLIYPDLIPESNGVDDQPHFRHLHFVKVLLSHFPSICPSEEFPQDNVGIFHPTAPKWEDRRKIHLHRDLKIIIVNQFQVFYTLEFKMVLNINYIPVTSENRNICLFHKVFEKENIKSFIPRAKEPSTSSTVCETSIWFHAFKKPKKRGCKERYIYFWFLTLV